MIFEEDVYELEDRYHKSFLPDNFWESIINQEVRHNKFGLGIVVGFEARKNAEAILKIQFNINDKNTYKEFPFSLLNNYFTLKNEFKNKLDIYLKAVEARKEFKLLRDVYKDFDWNKHSKNLWNRSLKRYAGIPGTGKRR
jgi:hypothetical protein